MAEYFPFFSDSEKQNQIYKGEQPIIEDRKVCQQRWGAFRPLVAFI